MTGSCRIVCGMGAENGNIYLSDYPNSPNKVPETDKGEKGAAGRPGKAGPQGPPGERGLTGMPGKGLYGPKGEKGAEGPHGPQGDRGLQGPVGEGKKGDVGDKGQKGEQGYRGPRGQPGDPAPYHPMIRYVHPPAPGPLKIVFSATNTYKDARYNAGGRRRNSQATTSFSHVLVNSGGHYHTRNSVFIAPMNGTYSFTFSVPKHHKEDLLEVHLMRNLQKQVVAIATGPNPGVSMATNTAIIHLDDKDLVWVKVHRGAIEEKERLATFTGCLLFPDLGG
ncbi:PREDICTED: complement C1q tumor necrosis factor-related protein 3-like [Branchiostoma belcheri]|uniref:Complement C1q tumor necrosis factor-related protein 3-like n=1 Tax=Branchiostoma belcheri TaxID=7741 RepID=A0A6P4YGB0_BRABE|nr:PREDICTED: complement C1q tumor necrosis factor-related protein 3-like [Branchiostoma belcheri]